MKKQIAKIELVAISEDLALTLWDNGQAIYTLLSGNIERITYSPAERLWCTRAYLRVRYPEIFLVDALDMD